MPVRNLLDEQQTAGDPLNNNNAKPCITPWIPSMYAEYYPIEYPEYPGPAAVIDLQSLFEITNICIYIANNNASNWLDFIITWNFTKTNPFEDPTLSITTNITRKKYANHWNCFNITNIISGFITVSLYNPPSTSFTEIVVYGLYSQPQYIPPHKFTNTFKVPRKPLKSLMGSSGFGYTPVENFTNTVGAVRQWQMWPWIEGNNNHNYPGYPNTAQATFCQDDVLLAQRKNNVSVHACVWHVPGWVHNWNETENDWKPIADNILHQPGASVDPKNWIMFADHMFQKAARYGRVKVDDKLLKLAPNRSLNDSTPQPRLSGMDVLDWIETYNEPNCGGGEGGREYWWSNIEIVAMQSAVYDGHMHSMPDTVGIKNADPSMNVSFPGLCGGSNDSATSDDFYGILYNWQTVVWWSDYFRNGSIPAEAFAYHFYARNCTGCWPTVGVSPEEYNVYEMGKKLVEWRDNNMPSVEVWLTEWGYSTNYTSEVWAPSIGDLDSQQVQGMWIMRTILAVHAAGLDRSTQFIWNDLGYTGSWGMTGLTDFNYNPKKSYYYFVAMYRNLKEYYFVDRDCDLMNGNVCVQLYEYGNSYAYVVWCPTSKNQVIKDFILQVVDFNSSYVTLVTPTVGNADGVKTNLKVNENTVVLTVTELPVFVMSRI